MKKSQKSGIRHPICCSHYKGISMLNRVYKMSAIINNRLKNKISADIGNYQFGLYPFMTIEQYYEYWSPNTADWS